MIAAIDGPSLGFNVSEWAARIERGLVRISTVTRSPHGRGSGRRMAGDHAYSSSSILKP